MLPWTIPRIFPVDPVNCAYSILRKWNWLESICTYNLKSEVILETVGVKLTLRILLYSPCMSSSETSIIGRNSSRYKWKSVTMSTEMYIIYCTTLSQGLAVSIDLTFNRSVEQLDFAYILLSAGLKISMGNVCTGKWKEIFK